MITIGYKILFTIDLLHEYYTDWRSNDLVLHPSPRTEEVLKNYNLLYRLTENGLIVFAKITDSDGTLNTPIPDTDNFKLIFYLKNKSLHFHNLTDLPLKSDPIKDFFPYRRAYYFDNETDNQSDPTNIPAHFQKPIKHLSKNPGAQVSFAEDGVLLMPKIFKVRFDSPATSFALKVHDKSGVLIDTINPTVALEHASTEFQVELGKFPNGFYKIQLDAGSTHNVYLDDQVFHSAPFGLIQIVHQSSLPADYQFISGAGGSKINAHIISPSLSIATRYYLYFKNRAVHWRYIFSGTVPAGITGTGMTFNPNVNLNALESTNPIVLEQAYKEVKLPDDIKIPNPDGKNLKPDINNSGTITKITAEVYL